MNEVVKPVNEIIEPVNKVVAVTGATGLVGMAVVKWLSLRGYKVIAVARDEEKLKNFLAQLPLSSKSFVAPSPYCCALSQESLTKAFAGADIVVHAAGFVSPTADRQVIFDINFGGTRAAFGAAQDAGVKQFIHISSLSVITGQGDQFNLDEEAPLRLCGEAYADSKVETEKWLTSENGACAWTILRPGFIYGVGERSWLPRLIDSISSGKAMLVDGGFRETNLVYADNLSLAVELALGNEKAYRQVFNITDGQKITKKDLFDAVADCLGLSRVKKSIPRWLLFPVAKIVTAATASLPPEKRVQYARFSPGAFRLAAVNQGFSINKAVSVLGYKDTVPFEAAMRETLKRV